MAVVADFAVLSADALEHVQIRPGEVTDKIQARFISFLGLLEPVSTSKIVYFGDSISTAVALRIGVIPHSALRSNIFYRVYMSSLRTRIPSGDAAVPSWRVTLTSHASNPVFCFLSAPAMAICLCLGHYSNRVVLILRHISYASTRGVALLNVNSGIVLPVHYMGYQASLKITEVGLVAL